MARYWVNVNRKADIYFAIALDKIAAQVRHDGLSQRTTGSIYRDISPLLFILSVF